MMMRDPLHDPAALAGARILVLGDLMLDRYVHGTVTRMSPEAPVPVLAVERESAMPGGAGNVARNIASLGARCILIGVEGNDAAGRELRALMARESRIDYRPVSDATRPTTCKTRFVAGRQQLLRADSEEAAPPGAAVVEALAAAVTDALKDVDLVILSDYAKGVLMDGLLARVIGMANKSGKPVIADPKGRDFARYRGADLITPNRHEAALVTGLPCADNASVLAAGRKLIEACGVGAVLITRGEQGMTLIEAALDPVHLEAEAREVFDVSGAGDTVIAVLAAARAVGASLTDAAKLANIAAGIVVGKVGTATVRPGELAQGAKSAAFHGAEAKVVNREEAAERVAQWRAHGLRVGFTNGCFDLLHPGHLTLINQARMACDRLIVAINADTSVKKLKGETRPVQSETARALVLASLADVDLVVIFAEDTPIPLLELLRPEVLVKGGDYSIEQVVGGDLVSAYGGKVMLADHVEGESTTNTLARMKRK